ncbi:MAG: glutamate--tRNA ligase family protein, partial [Calditerricola sp.]|nr:glutamate--tRNA ligase family protein [Calditerricola sp.]
RFAHLSLILNPNRQKMSKRDESIIQFIEQYRTLGYLPEALVNFLVLLGWAPEGEYAEQEFFSLDELVRLFSLERVSKAPAVFDPERLRWMNNHYLRQRPAEEVAKLAHPHLAAAGRLPEVLSDDQWRWLVDLVTLFQEQMGCAADIVPLSELFFREDVVYNEEAKAVLAESHVPTVLAAFRREAEALTDWNAGAVKNALKAVQKATGHKGKQLFMPIRVAVTGQTHGPDLAQTLFLLGRERVVSRLIRALDALATG